MADGRVAIIGFDAAESSLARRGIDEGWLPTLAQLVESGRWTSLSPVPSGFYNTSWASTVTGQDVFAHEGIFDRQLDPGSYRILDVPASSIRQPPFWRYLSDAGVRSTIASVYSAPVLPSFKGAQAQGWGSIDPYWAKFEETVFDPPEVEQLLDRAVERRQRLYRIPAPRTISDFRRYRDRMVSSIDEQARGLVALVEGTDWDFFLASFSEPHQAGHLLWHLTDPAHPDYDPEAPEDLRDALPAVYRAADAGIGRVLQRLPDACRVFVLTPHGMAPNYIQDPGEQLLECGGWQVRRTGTSGGGRRQFVRTAWSIGRRVTPTRLRVAAHGRLGRGGVRAEMPLAHVDWQRSRAFALPSDMTAYIRVNLQGREPEGIVVPGREYELLCDELCEALESLTHAESGAPAVEKVVRFDRLFGRPADGAMPDLCVVWADTERITCLALPGHGTVEMPTGDPRTGQHRHLGFLIGAGPGIAADPGESTANLLDVAPTALALLGVDRPAALPGRPIDAFVPA